VSNKIRETSRSKPWPAPGCSAIGIKKNCLCEKSEFTDENQLTYTELLCRHWLWCIIGIELSGNFSHPRLLDPLCAPDHVGALQRTLTALLEPVLI
jgi:hypothetical protein